MEVPQMEWNAKTYTKYLEERTQPSIDLINRININPKTILDIGCGPGNSTFQLHKKFEQAIILGIDSSNDMLKNASSNYPTLNFKKCFIPDELDSLESFDLIFSNACIHWIPNHHQLIPQIMSKVNSGGLFAVQIPLVQYAPFYKILNELLLEKEWKKLREINNFHNLSPEETYDILSSVSSKTEMWETTYYHIVYSHNAVIDWYTGSGLKPYLDCLDDNEKVFFTDALLERIKVYFPLRNNGAVILKMPRLFFIAKK